MVPDVVKTALFKPNQSSFNINFATINVVHTVSWSQWSTGHNHMESITPFSTSKAVSNQTQKVNLSDLLICSFGHKLKSISFKHNQFGKYKKLKDNSFKFCACALILRLNKKNACQVLELEDYKCNSFLQMYLIYVLRKLLFPLAVMERCFVLFCFVFNGRHYQRFGCG